MLIGVSGYARSGKDTIADHLVKHHGFTKMSFADPMREALLRLDPIITVGGHYVSLSSAVRINGWEDLKAMSPDIRPLMQRLGTEVGRNMFGQDFWVDYAIGQSWKHKNVVFADVRFKNEADVVNSNWGWTWRVNRPGFEAANDHISEHDLDQYADFHYVLDNDSDLKSLYKKVDGLLEEMN